MVLHEFGKTYWDTLNQVGLLMSNRNSKTFIFRVAFLLCLGKIQLLQDFETNDQTRKLTNKCSLFLRRWDEIIKNVNIDTYVWCFYFVPSLFLEITVMKRNKCQDLVYIVYFYLNKSNSCLEFEFYFRNSDIQLRQ